MLENGFCEVSVGTVEIARKKSDWTRIEEIFKEKKNKYRVLMVKERELKSELPLFKGSNKIRTKHFSFEYHRRKPITSNKSKENVLTRDRLTRKTPVPTLPMIKGINIKQFQCTPRVLECLKSLKTRMSINNYE